MIYTDERLLLLPPKTSSRWCEQHVVGHRLRDGSEDHRRHAALHQLPGEVAAGREVYCLTRDPFRWYESWWAHMRRQSFAWSRQWGHEPVPAFREALHDYCFAWKRREYSAPHGLAGSMGSTAGSVDHMDRQARLGVGWWSYMMWWTVEKPTEPLAWNRDARWVFTGAGLQTALGEAGFESRAGHPVGVGHYERPTWDAEMVSWVVDADWSVLRRVLEQSVGEVPDFSLQIG